MTGKSVKDVDRYQAVLNSLLALEENKYCADCESKGRQFVRAAQGSVPLARLLRWKLRRCIFNLSTNYGALWCSWSVACGYSMSRFPTGKVQDVSGRVPLVKDHFSENWAHSKWMNVSLDTGEAADRRTDKLLTLTYPEQSVPASWWGHSETYNLTKRHCIITDIQLCYRDPLSEVQSMHFSVKY